MEVWVAATALSHFPSKEDFVPGSTVFLLRMITTKLLFTSWICREQTASLFLVSVEKKLEPQVTSVGGGWPSELVWEASTTGMWHQQWFCCTRKGCRVPQKTEFLGVVLLYIKLCLKFVLSPAVPQETFPVWASEIRKNRADSTDSNPNQ